MFEKIFKRKKLLIGVLIILIGGSYFLFFGEKEVKYITREVSRTNILQTVSVTGSVEADPQIKLRFQAGGKIKEIPVKVGDRVEEGDLLARLDDTSLGIDVDRARSNLSLAQANLNKLLAGATGEDIAVSESNVQSAEIALKAAQDNLKNVKRAAREELEKAKLSLKSTEIAFEEAKNSLENTDQTYEQNLTNAYENARPTLYNTLLVVQSSLQSTDDILGIDVKEANDYFEVFLGILNSQSLTTARRNYESAKRQYERTRDQYSVLVKPSESEIDSLLNQFQSLATLSQAAISSTDLVLANTTFNSSSFTQTDLEVKRTAINTAETSLNTAIISLQTASQNIINAKLSKDTQSDTAQAAYNTAEASLESAQHNLKKVATDLKNQIETAESQVKSQEAALITTQASLSLKKARPRAVDTASYYAQVQQAQAVLELAEHELSKASLKAPVDGVVTKLDFEKGENLTSMDTFLTMVSDKLKIIADVSETDITKIELGDEIEMTLDAFDIDDKFSGEVVEIEPAETEISGVVYYKVRATFTIDDSRIKPGMTVDMDITTDEKENILAVPLRTVKYRNGSRFVNILENKKVKEVEIKTGAEGDIYVEVLEGLEEGQEVIISGLEEQSKIF